LLITAKSGAIDQLTLGNRSTCWPPLIKVIRLFEKIRSMGPTPSLGYFAHYSCKGGPEESASLAFPQTHHCI